MDLKDIQQSLDHRNLELQRVGIKKLSYPCYIKDKDTTSSTTGSFDLSVTLPATQKGAHLSRFVALLQEYHEKKSLILSLESLPLWHKRMLTSHQATQGSFECFFRYFLEKKAPASLAPSLLDYQVGLACHGSIKDPTTTLSLCVPITSLCPCSREISKYGAHNQRSLLKLKALYSDINISLSSIIQCLEQQASCEIYGVLKRSDEKFITEKAYENPKFCEDIVRDAFLAIKKDFPSLSSIEIESEHFESIHHHNAYAAISE